MGCSGLRCTNRDSIAIFPQVSWEFGCVSPPTEFTEFTEVRLHKSSHRIHRIHRSFVALIRPRNSQNSQKLGCVSPPTDFTDLHRWLGCVCSPTDFTEFTEVRLHKSSHRFHGFAQMAWLRLFSHGIHRIHRSFVALIRPRNSQN